MNYDQHLTDLMDAMKADKDLSQPIKNYALSDAVRLQAVIRMAKINTNLQPPAGIPTTAAGCTCPFGVISATCPVHHGAVL